MLEEEGLRGSGGYLLDETGARFMFEYDKRGERATRDIVCRGVADRIRKGHASPNGGVYISMGHLGPENVRREFKGMVERCADCGFDLAGGKVEVVPTAHYMMGGVQFNADCTLPAMPRLYAAGEDTGEACTAPTVTSAATACLPTATVFGGLAGDSMGGEAQCASRRSAIPTRRAIRGLARARLRAVRPQAAPISRKGDAPAELYQVMWDERRHPAAHARKACARPPRSSNNARSPAYRCMGVPDPRQKKRYNLTWMDRLNLENLVLTSRAICYAAQARADSRGAHYREDFPQASDLESSAATPWCARRTRASRVCDRAGCQRHT